MLLTLAAFNACRASVHEREPDKAYSKRPETQQAPPQSAPAPSHEAKSTSECVRVGGPIQPPRKVHHLDAELSEAALRTRTHGGVMLYEMMIDEEGQVRDVRPLKPIDSAAPWPELDRAWRAAIAEWKYAPTVVDGKPSRVCMTVSVLIDVM